MKKTLDWLKYKILFLLTVLINAPYLLLAQEEGGTAEVTINRTETTTEQWYTEPWAWIVGGVLLFILLLAAVLGGGRRSDGTTVRKTTTVTKDDVYDA